MLPLRIVLDTNVVVSALLNSDGLERSVLLLALTPPAKLFVSGAILAEYGLVLRRPRLKIDPARTDELLSLINELATTVTPAQRVVAATDQSDNKFLECVQAAGADYLVTGNKRHFPKTWAGTIVVNAREFLNVISPELEES